MKVSVERYEDFLAIFVTGVVKDAAVPGYVGFYVYDSGNKYRIVFFKDGQIRINKCLKELVDAACIFIEIINTYFENEQ